MVGTRRKLVKRIAKSQGAQIGRWLGSFLDYLRTECHVSDNTIAAYRRDLARFRGWLGSRSVRHLQMTELSDYAAWLHQQQLAPASVARHSSEASRRWS